MPDDDTTAGQESEGDDTGEGNGDDTGANEGSGEAGTGEKLTPEAAAAAVASANKEAAKFRRQAREAQAEVEKLRNAGLSEEERQAKERQQLEERTQAAELRAVKAEVRATALELAGTVGITDVTLALRLLDYGELDLEADEQQLRNDVEKQLSQLVREHPSLSGKGRSSGGGGDAGAGQESNGTGKSINDQIRDAAGR